jgi:hypothetical protein
MKLIVFYVVFVLIGESLAYFIGRTVEIWSKAASLPVFLACLPCLLGCLATRGPRDLIVEVPERDAVYSEPAQRLKGFPCSRRREASRTRRES